MKIESYSVLCDGCYGRGYNGHQLCSKCDGNGHVLVPDEKRTLEAAIDNYRRWAAGFRAAVRRLGA
jgi:DnaJ-class molecular chaperone